MAQAVDIQGHRGARGLRPENTLPGFALAIGLGVDTLELDLHLTADDVVVVWHDPALDPKKCRGARNERLRDLAYEELARFSCNLNPDPKRFPDQTAPPGDYRIPKLGDVLDLGAKTSVRFNIETKRRFFEHDVIAQVRERGLESRVTIQSFEHESLWTVHQLAPEISLAALTEGDVDLGPLAERGATIWSPNHKALTGAQVQAAHNLALEVVPWTVNDPDRMRELLALGVDGLITDRPDLALQLRNVEP